MKTCQIILLILLVLNFFSTLYWDVNGRKAKEPTSFSGVVTTIIITALIAWLYYKAGAFSTIF